MACGGWKLPNGVGLYAPGGDLHPQKLASEVLSSWQRPGWGRWDTGLGLAGARGHPCGCHPSSGEARLSHPLEPKLLPRPIAPISAVVCFSFLRRVLETCLFLSRALFNLSLPSLRLSELLAQQLLRQIRENRGDTANELSAVQTLPSRAGIN